MGQSSFPNEIETSRVLIHKSMKLLARTQEATNVHKLLAPKKEAAVGEARQSRIRPPKPDS